MDESSIEQKSRRVLLKTILRFTAGFAALPAITTIGGARAEGKLAKADVSYQDKPSKGKDCDDCMHFIPGATAKANGTCKIVEGEISPHGYCAAFTRNRTKPV